jgi:hypothetical protein
LIFTFSFKAVKKMEQAIRGRGDSRLRDLAMMTEFAHTGPNEALNALRNKASKVVRFYYSGVLVDRHQWHADPDP